MNNIYIAKDDKSLYLSHHGILGQKLGVRRYQNPNGTLTSEGRRRYGLSDDRYTKSQMIQDKKLYGKGAVKRVAKKLAKGENLISSRHDEAKRKYDINSIRDSSVAALSTAGGYAVARLLHSYLKGESIDTKRTAIVSAASGGAVFIYNILKKQSRNPYR